MKYENEYLNEFKFPVGGIGTGCISIDGAGLLRDFEIFNRPSKYSTNGFTHFAIRVENENGETYTRVLCGDSKENLCGGYLQDTAHSHGFGFGISSVTMNGFPHFRKVKADCSYPKGIFTFEDDQFPGIVELTAWNPLIPHNSFDSSLPVAFLGLKYKPKTKGRYRLMFVLSFGCPFKEAFNTAEVSENYSAVHITSTDDQDSVQYGDITIACEGEGVQTQTNWYRGEWCDSIITYWKELTGGSFLNRSYETPGCDQVTVIKTVETQDDAKADFLITWNIPNCTDYWHNNGYGTGKWKNWYATQFFNSGETAKYCCKNRQKFLEETDKYCSAMFGQTLPAPIIEAAANTISVLRSPTVVRLENGAIYGFEGVAEKEGSCEGTCQHVWNYAYALCFLFPDLERSIRDLEFKYEMQSNGETFFRIGLPLGAECALKFPCFDGQMGCVIKTYREWKISGDDDWLRSVWSDVKQVLDFARSKDNSYAWDADGDGIAEGRMHHTLDMELFGPNGWLQGMYLASLKAAEKMAEYLGEPEKAEEYRNLFNEGKKYAETELWNGKWFQQKINLRDKTLLERFNCVDIYWNEETNEIKYQIGNGCEIDQLLGQWHASINGLGEIYNFEQSKVAANSIYENNFKKSMRNIVNPWRLFAVNDEPGTMMCTYPDGVYQPTIPLPYGEECMNGFEYAFAGVLIALGEVKKGIEVASAVREKYTGANRNPFNEIECGSNYSRSMASFALIPLLSGFSFDIPNGSIGFNPKIGQDEFRGFWSVGNAYGIYEQKKESLNITIFGGNLELRRFESNLADKIQTVIIDQKIIPFSVSNSGCEFDKIRIVNQITFNLK